MHLVLQKQNELKPQRNSVSEVFFLLLIFYVAGMPSKIKNKCNFQDYSACKVFILTLIAKC